MSRGGDDSAKSTDTEVVVPTVPLGRKAPIDPQAETVVDASAPRAPSDASHRLARGTTVSRYVVIDFLGEGGMGQVFAAYDPELDRRVAIKLLHAGDQLQARLLREAKAMAKLSHPNVVTVHDVSTHAGDLFVAMELVDGMTLKDWLAASPRSWRDIVGAFVQAGRGLDAAHEAGIVHRDFKPANVLVRSDGRVLVTDFGLARSAGTASSEASGDRPANRDLTAAGSLLGTPAYMSPEHFAGRPVDARSDQFCFCVALYEGLYGGRPFSVPPITESGHVDPAHLDESCWVVPPPPRDSSVPSWLRQVVVRGLAFDPAQRYGAMKDLLRELSRDPYRKRRVAIAAAAAIALAGSAAAFALTRTEEPMCRVPSSVAIAAAWNPEAKLRIQTAFEGSKRAYWRATFDRIVEELDQRAKLWRAAWVDVCEATHVEHAQSPAVLDLRMQCLDRRAGELGALVDVFARAPDPEILDRAVRAVAGLPETTECARGDQLSARVPLPSDPALRSQITVLRARLDEVIAKVRAGTIKDLAVAADALAAETATVSYPPLEAEARFWASRVHGDQRDGKAAEAQLRLAMNAAAAGRDDVVMMRVLNSLINVLGLQERYAEAEALAAVAEAAAQRLGDEEQRADLAFHRGRLEQNQRRFATGRTLLEDALAMRTKLFGADHPTVAATHDALGVLLDEAGEWEAARSHFERAIAIVQKVHGPDHPAVAQARLGIGVSFYRAGKPADAVPHFEDALRIWEAAYGPDHVNVGKMLNNLVALRMDMGELDAALEVGLRALAFKEKHSGPDSVATAMTLYGLGSVMLKMKRYPEARAYHERALAIRAKEKGGERQVAESYLELAAIELHDGHAAEGVRLLGAALAIVEKEDPENPFLVSILVALARAHLDLERPAVALPHVERALAIATKKQVHPYDLADVQFALARSLWALGRDRERALALAKEAHETFQSLGPGAREALETTAAWLAAHHL